MISLDGIHRPLHVHGEPFFGILRTKNAIEQWPIDLDPDFQRGHVWTREQQCAFVGHILEGGHVQPLIVNMGPGGVWEVGEMVDGKQRVTACLAWAEGSIPAVLTDRREVWAKDLDKTSRTRCSLSIGMRYGMAQLTRAEALELYLRVNRGGTVHTEAEIARVRELLAKEREATS